MKRLSKALIGVPTLALALSACSTNVNPAALLRPNDAPTAQPAAVQPPAATITKVSAPATVAAQTTAPANASAQSGLDALFAQQQAFEQIYNRVRPSVVQIVVSGAAASAQTDNPAPFGNVPELQNPNQPGQRTGGLGSGFVYDNDGHIVTNNHVVEGAEKITVRFSDDTTAEAKLVGRDPYADLAVIKVDALPQGTQPLALAKAADFRVGQLTIALGNPFGLPGSMTTGIISGLERNLPTGTTPYQLPGIIQTDAAINPGNSGGPLLDLNGNVIGVNTAIESASGSSSGIGFAVPADQVQRVVPQLISDGAVQYAWLGVEMTDVTPTVAKELGLPVERGALVSGVTANGPALKAGVKGSNRKPTAEGQLAPGGDVITAVDGAPVTVSEDVIRAVLGHKPGDSVSLTVQRDGKQQQIRVTLGERPSNPQR